MNIVVFIFGMFLVVWTLISAMRSVVLPRGARVKLTQFVFQGLGLLFFPLARRIKTFVIRDHWLALYAPVSVLLLPVIWLCLVLSGFACMFWGLGVSSWHEAFTLSGSSLLTLGFAQPKNISTMVFSFAEAILGIGVLSLMITYLPTLYSAFARRETLVTRLSRRVGAPPSALALFRHFSEVQPLDQLGQIWSDWEEWFAELEESHSSFPFLVFFRSPAPRRSWITAAGTVLDSAAIAISTFKDYDCPPARLTLHTGYMALQAIAVVLDLPYNSDPHLGDPISISRAEYDEMYDNLAALHFSLVADREKAWQNFSEIRARYDQVLLALASRIFAPSAPWSADRSLPVDRTTQPNLTQKLFHHR